ncbi:hypothetical protein HOT95_gp035 [Vibrio phage vB_VpS_PG07]|uniref:Uncharacterized protein n=1 Tax=Vibrio phage vB_VpS_PG07 TaxID=2301664 RepID=A0A385E4G0_9CAUD|nr:hypothetical protein HOT95_gp035 [Vibrio phage vB_VpS_PG07]AXQ66660.1 hypothetical protein [Vibrio phage vB_VpS_PG07]
MHNPRPPRPNVPRTQKPIIVELRRVLKEPLRTKKVTQSLFPISSRKHKKEEAFFLIGRLVTVTRKWFGLSSKTKTEFVYVVCLGSSMVGYTGTKEAAKSVVRTLNKEMS